MNWLFDKTPIFNWVLIVAIVSTTIGIVFRGSELIDRVF